MNYRASQTIQHSIANLHHVKQQDTFIYRCISVYTHVIPHPARRCEETMKAPTFLIASTWAGISLAKTRSGVSWNALDAANRTFDYIIVGGGLTGLALAGRLVEDPLTTVLVIEAGKDNRTSPLVQDIYTFGQAYGGELDWYYPTELGRTISG